MPITAEEDGLGGVASVQGSEPGFPRRVGAVRRFVLGGIASATLMFAAIADASAEFPRKLAAGQALRSDFVDESRIPGFTKPMHSTGLVFVVPGTGSAWKVEAPFPMTIAIDARGMRQFVAGQALLSFGPAQFPAGEALRRIMEAGMTGDWRTVKSMLGVSPVADGDGWRVVYTPKADARMPFIGLTVTGHAYVERAVVNYANGGMDILTFSGHQVMPKAEALSAAGVPLAGEP